LRAVLKCLDHVFRGGEAAYLTGSKIRSAHYGLHAVAVDVKLKQKVARNGSAVRVIVRGG